MNAQAITKRHAMETKKLNLKFETAKKIRELLDEAKKAYGSDWEDDDMESSILELVTEEE
jgi:hypothetical protein